jgi:hypothetical protein
MRTAEEYRSQAQQCYDLARRQPDPHSGYILRGVADSWLRLAEQAEAESARERFSEAA